MTAIFRSPRTANSRRGSTSIQGFHARLHRYLDKRARWLVPVCAFGLGTPIISAALASSAGTLVWLIDLASHWQWLYLAGLVLGCAIAVLKDRRWALWLLAVPLPWLTASSPAPNARSEEIPNAKVLAVASANVHLENRDTVVLVRWLATTKPDVVVLHEVSPGYVKGLGALDAYPFRCLMPRHDPFGMAVLSRFPLGKVQTVEDEDGIRHFDALLEWNGQLVKLTALHPMPPISQHYHSVRNQKLQGLAKAAKANEYPAIVAGDLNATPWSNAFSKLDQAGLRRASGLAPTWPAVGRGLMGIPIDHVLVTQQWSVVEQQVGPNLGSDHLPVIVRIAIRADEKRKP